MYCSKLKMTSNKHVGQHVHRMFKEQKCCIQGKWYQVQGWCNSKTFTNRAQIGLVLFFLKNWYRPVAKILDTMSPACLCNVKPLSHQTTLPQRLYSVLKPCQHAVGSPRKTPKNIKFVSYSVYTTSSQRPYSVHPKFPSRLYSVHDVFTARKQLLQRVHSTHTAFSWRAQSPHGDYSV